MTEPKRLSKVRLDMHRSNAYRNTPVSVLDIEELLSHIAAVEAERDNALGYDEKMHNRAVIAEKERDTLKSELERVKRELYEVTKCDCQNHKPVQEKQK